MHFLDSLATWTCLIIAKKVGQLVENLNSCILNLSLWCLVLTRKFVGNIKCFWFAMGYCDLILLGKCSKGL